MNEFTCGEPAKLVIRLVPFNMADEGKGGVFRGDSVSWTNSRMVVNGKKIMYEKWLGNAYYSITVEPA